MGYTGKSGKIFSSRFCRRERAVGTSSPRFGMAKGRIAHGANLSAISDFLQDITARSRSFSGRLS
jgi:hypothetical protein